MHCPAVPLCPGTGGAIMYCLATYTQNTRGSRGRARISPHHTHVVRARPKHRPTHVHQTCQRTAGRRCCTVHLAPGGSVKSVMRIRTFSNNVRPVAWGGPELASAVAGGGPALSHEKWTVHGHGGSFPGPVINLYPVPSLAQAEVTGDRGQSGIARRDKAGSCWGATHRQMVAVMGDSSHQDSENRG